MTSYAAVQTIWISTGAVAAASSRHRWPCERAARSRPARRRAARWPRRRPSTADRTPACWPRRPASARSAPCPGRPPLRGDREAVERGMASQLTTGLEVDVPTQRALAQELAVLVGQLTRDVDARVDTLGGSRTSCSHLRREAPGRAPGAAPSPNCSWCESQTSVSGLLVGIGHVRQARPRRSRHLGHREARRTIRESSIISERDCDDLMTT